MRILEWPEPSVAHRVPAEAGPVWQHSILISRIAGERAFANDILKVDVGNVKVEGDFTVRGDPNMAGIHYISRTDSRGQRCQAQTVDRNPLAVLDDHHA